MSLSQLDPGKTTTPYFICIDLIKNAGFDARKGTAQQIKQADFQAK
jgi:hypothetical protein